MGEARVEPVWFGPRGEPLFGLLNVPEGPSRGAVVLCPPLGRECTNSYSTFLQLAGRLAELGFVVLRFDYRSTGDSFDRLSGAKGAPGFLGDVASALEMVRSLGASKLAVVGMRLGANFARAQCAKDPVEALVLWDPCTSGRTFLREQRVLGLVASSHVGVESLDALDLPGLELSAEMSEEISALDAAKDSGGSKEGAVPAQEVLLLTRLGREDTKLAERFNSANVHHMEVPGQPELLDVQSPEQIVPFEAMETVAVWLDKVMPRDHLDIAVPKSSEITVTAPPGGWIQGGTAGDSDIALRERTLRLGPVGLFGIETAPVIGTGGPTCLFFSVANEHRIGPGRLWVTLSRSLAAAGFRCVRVDVNGFGDSPARDGWLSQPVHSALAIDDVLDSARAVSPGDPGNVVLFGLCSSGYQILEAALSLTPKGVCSLNPSLVFEPPEMASSRRMDARRRFCLPESGLVNAAGEKRPVQWLRRRFPRLVSDARRDLRMVTWRLRSAVGLLKNRPGERLEDLVESGTDVLLIGGPTEMRPFAETGLSVDHMTPPEGRLQVEVLPTLQHSLLSRKDRDEVASIVIEHVRRGFQPPSEVGGPDMAGRGDLGGAARPRRG